MASSNCSIQRALEATSGWKSPPMPLNRCACLLTVPQSAPHQEPPSQTSLANDPGASLACLRLHGPTPCPCALCHDAPVPGIQAAKAWRDSSGKACPGMHSDRLPKMFLIQAVMHLETCRIACSRCAVELGIWPSCIPLLLASRVTACLCRALAACIEKAHAVQQVQAAQCSAGLSCWATQAVPSASVACACLLDTVNMATVQARYSTGLLELFSPLMRLERLIKLVWGSRCLRVEYASQAAAQGGIVDQVEAFLEVGIRDRLHQHRSIEVSGQ